MMIINMLALLVFSPVSYASHPVYYLYDDGQNWLEIPACLGVGFGWTYIAKVNSLADFYTGRGCERSFMKIVEVLFLFGVFVAPMYQLFLRKSVKIEAIDIGPRLPVRNHRDVVLRQRNIVNSFKNGLFFTFVSLPFPALIGCVLAVSILPKGLSYLICLVPSGLIVAFGCGKLVGAKDVNKTLEFILKARVAFKGLVRSALLLQLFSMYQIVRPDETVEVPLGTKIMLVRLLALIVVCIAAHAGARSTGTRADFDGVGG